MLGAPNIASKEWIYRQYDQFVRTNTLVASGADAAVIRVKGTKKGLALTVDGNSRYCFLDPYVGGVLAVAEAARNFACVGARPVGLTDCLNFGSPENPEVMWQFAQVIQGMRDACMALKVPVVSGNVSFYNETDGVPILSDADYWHGRVAGKSRPRGNALVQEPRATWWCCSGGRAKSWAAANISKWFTG